MVTMPKISLKAARVNKNLTQIKAAELIGVSVSTLKNWESGISYPKQPHIMKMCELYEISYDMLDFS